MTCTARTLPAILFLATSLATCVGAANAETATTEDDNSRAVHVIQEPGASSERKQVALGAIKTDTKVVNNAELSLDLLPGLDVAVGTKVSFRVSAKKPGYLIVVDVDPTGKLTQIYPYPGTMTADRPLTPDVNYIK